MLEIAYSNLPELQTALHAMGDNLVQQPHRDFVIDPKPAREPQPFAPPLRRNSLSSVSRAFCLAVHRRYRFAALYSARASSRLSTTTRSGATNIRVFARLGVGSAAKTDAEHARAGACRVDYTRNGRTTTLGPPKPATPTAWPSRLAGDQTDPGLLPQAPVSRGAR